MNEKVEQCATNKFCVKLKKTFSEMIEIIVDGFGEGVVAHITIRMCRSTSLVEQG